MSGVKIVPQDAHFSPELEKAGNKLVIVDFHATWCNPCKIIAPVFEHLSKKYPNIVFLKVDVDQCKSTAEQYNVTAMPTFIFIKSKVVIAQIKGADPKKLMSKI